jgi:HlyD family secretion protein
MQGGGSHRRSDPDGAAAADGPGSPRPSEPGVCAPVLLPYVRPGRLGGMAVRAANVLCSRRSRFRGRQYSFSWGAWLMGWLLHWLYCSAAFSAGESTSTSAMPTTSGAPTAPAGPAGMGGPAQWWTYRELQASAIVIVLAVILWLVGRATRSRYLKPGYVSGVALLLVALLVTNMLVRVYKKPGQTTLLEAQAMDMSVMRPPVGTVPVATEVVKPTSFAPAVTYTGTVVAYNDEDVFPRVPGTIVAMPVYPGDQVRAGQLLVRLDDREYAGREREAQWDREMAVRARSTSLRESEMAAAARQQAEAGVAKSQQELKVMQREVTTSQSMVKESQSDVQQARHNVEAARRELEAAQAEQEQALAEASMASAGIETAQADVETMKADLAYWEEEIKRAKQLLDTGAYSTDEFQREQSEYKAAQAKVAQAQSMVAEKRQALAAAQAASKRAAAAVAGGQARLAAMQSEADKTEAGLERARSELSTAEARVESAQAEVRAAQAMRDEKAAGVRASTARIAEASAAIPQRAAALSVAQTVRGYTEIRAARPGSVIQRLVSPGVLVQPGAAMLRIAQLDRVRLQAYVSEHDVQSLRVGSRVEARSPKLPRGTLVAQVTSISPSADPTTRTSVVEALVNNPGRALYPGDALSLRLFGAEHASVLTVPSSAIVYRAEATGGPSSSQQATVWLALAQTGPPGKTTYTCTMHPDVHPDQPGKCPKCGMDLVPEKATSGKKAHQVDVTVGASDGQRTEVRAGLKEGDEVIVRGRESLQEGFLVYPVPWTEAGPAGLPPPAMSGGQGSGPAAGGAPGGMKM